MSHGVEFQCQYQKEEEQVAQALYSRDPFQQLHEYNNAPYGELGFQLKVEPMERLTAKY